MLPCADVHYMFKYTWPAVCIETLHKKNLVGGGTRSLNNGTDHIPNCAIIYDIHWLQMTKIWCWMEQRLPCQTCHVIAV